MTLATDGKSRLAAVSIAVRRVGQVMFADGVLPGLLRLAFSGACVGLLANAFRGGDAAAGAVMALVFMLLVGYLVGWGELLVMVVAPDWSLWHPEPGMGWGRRIALTACRLLVAWILWVCIVVGVAPQGGLILLLPFAVASLPSFCRAGRAVAVLRAGDRPNGGSVAGL